MRRILVREEMDTLYFEKANGHYEAWTYSDGERVYVKAAGHTQLEILAYGKKHHYRTIYVPPNP